MNYEQQRVLDILKFLLSLFNQHNLRYMAAFGTVLGAIRHGGFIPWDDDVDLYMPREDYIKLLSLRDEIKKEGYDIVSLNDNGYYLPFCKIIDMRSTIWEYKTFPFAIGFFVDIFPLDSTSESYETVIARHSKANQLFYNYKLCIARYSFSDFIYSMEKRNKDLFKEILKTWFMRPFSTKYLNAFKDYEKKYASEEGERYLCYIGCSPGKLFPKNWFDNAKETDFEDIRIKVPQPVDEYLKLFFGDYMIPPPESKRVSGHVRYYFDPSKRLSIKEMRLIIKNKNGDRQEQHTGTE